MNEQLTFEESLIELERAVRDLEDANSVSMKRWRANEQGGRPRAPLLWQLRDAEQRILLLTGVDENNQPILTPFKHEATAPPSRTCHAVAKSRNRPRSPGLPEAPLLVKRC